MQQPYILGIDIGTGSTKAVAVDFSGAAFYTSQCFYPTQHPKPGYSEQDPELIYKAFITCINEVINKLDAQPTGISLSSVMHSIIPVNANGQPIFPMITWADARSAYIADRIRTDPAGEQIYKATGTPVFAMSPLSKIIWIKERAPGIFEKTHKFISIKEFIWFRLFDDFQVDHSVACGMGLVDIHSLKWSLPALAVAGIREDNLSTPVSTGYTRRDFNPEKTELKSIVAGTPFVIGGSDGCLANLGSLAIEKGIAAITIGTSGAVRISNPEPVYNFDAMTFNYRLDEETFICGGPVNNGGIIIQWLMKNLLGVTELSSAAYARLFQTIEDIPPGSEGLVFLPYLTGERAPVWDTNSSGVFLGMRLHHTQAHFARAVLEGVCFGLYQVLEALEERSGIIRRIHVSGGFISSKPWIHLLADVTGKPVAMVQAEDASATGAAILAMRSLNIIADYSSFLKERKLALIEPDLISHEKYQTSFNVFKQLYSQLKDSMHLLHQANY